MRKWKILKILSTLCSVLQSTFSIAHTSGKAVATLIIVMSNVTIPTLLEEIKMEAAVQQNSLVQIAVCSQKFPQKKIKWCGVKLTLMQRSIWQCHMYKIQKVHTTQWEGFENSRDIHSSHLPWYLGHLWFHVSIFFFFIPKEYIIYKNRTHWYHVTDRFVIQILQKKKKIWITNVECDRQLISLLMNVTVLDGVKLFW